MRVDVHTHIWPDRIAEAVAGNMQSDLGFAPIAPNTVAGIKEHMESSGVDKSIVLGVAIRADQVRRANDWLISGADESLVPFGAVHPDLTDKAAEIRHLRANGVKGIKMHPVINGFYPDDPQWFPVYEELGRRHDPRHPFGAAAELRRPFAAVRRTPAHHEHRATLSHAKNHRPASRRILYA